LDGRRRRESRLLLLLLPVSLLLLLLLQLLLQLLLVLQLALLLLLDCAVLVLQVTVQTSGDNGEATHNTHQAGRNTQTPKQCGELHHEIKETDNFIHCTNIIHVHVHPHKLPPVLPAFTSIEPQCSKGLIISQQSDNLINYNNHGAKQTKNLRQDYHTKHAKNE
jgi:hypothetical protein